MPQEKRIVTTRIRKRLEVRYGHDEPKLTGYSGNVSRVGMMLRSTRVYGEGTLLNLEIVFSDRAVRVKGRVSWARAGSIQMLSTGRVGMGIRFVDPPSDLVERIERGG